MKRYDYEGNDDTLDIIRNDKGGEFVLYTDAAAIEAERDRLRGQRDRLVEMLTEIVHQSCIDDTPVEHVKKCQAYLAEIEKESAPCPATACK